MENNLTWLLVADAGKARIFSLHKARLFQDNLNSHTLTLINDFTHQESRMKVSELISGTPGGFSKNSLGMISPKHHEAEQFAHLLLEQLNSGRLEHHYKDLILIAPPAFMGILNKFMPHEMHKLVCKTIEKDYTYENVHDLTQRLVTHL